MATLTKVWSFDNNLDGWVSETGKDSEVLWNSGGYIEAGVTGRNTGATDNSNVVFSGTFQSIGLPSDATITHLEFKTDHSATTFNTVSYLYWGGYVDSVQRIATETYTGATSFATKTSGQFVYDAEAVDTFTLNILGSSRTGNNASASAYMAWDNVTLVVTYTVPIPNINGVFTDTSGFLQVNQGTKSALVNFIESVGFTLSKQATKQTSVSFTETNGLLQDTTVTKQGLVQFLTNLGILQTSSTIKEAETSFLLSNGSLLFSSAFKNATIDLIEDIGFVQDLFGLKNTGFVLYDEFGIEQYLIVNKKAQIDLLEDLGIQQLFGGNKQSQQEIVQSIGFVLSILTDTTEVKFVSFNDNIGVENIHLHTTSRANSFIDNIGLLQQQQSLKSSYVQLVSTGGYVDSLEANKNIGLSFSISQGIELVQNALKGAKYYLINELGFDENVISTKQTQSALAHSLGFEEITGAIKQSYESLLNELGIELLFESIAQAGIEVGFVESLGFEKLLLANKDTNTSLELQQGFVSDLLFAKSSNSTMLELIGIENYINYNAYIFYPITRKYSFGYDYGLTSKKESTIKEVRYVVYVSGRKS